MNNSRSRSYQGIRLSVLFPEHGAGHCFYFPGRVILFDSWTGN
jgi:hypothetical protein